MTAIGVFLTGLSVLSVGLYIVWKIRTRDFSFGPTLPDEASGLVGVLTVLGPIAIVGAVVGAILLFRHLRRDR